MGYTTFVVAKDGRLISLRSSSLTQLHKIRSAKCVELGIKGMTTNVGPIKKDGASFQFSMFRIVKAKIKVND